MQAGLEGLFAIERDKFAFETLSANLLNGPAEFRFQWPEWLPVQPFDINDLLRLYRSELQELAGSVDVLVGGPPCQGFSSAGKRDFSDPRNRLFESYLELIALLRPRAVLMENVRGFAVDFTRSDGVGNYATRLRRGLREKYDMFERLLDVSDFGVPQSRTRYFVMTFEPGICKEDPFDTLKNRLPSFLRTLGLRAPVPSWAAISDLEIARGGTRPSSDTPGFQEIRYVKPLTAYQRMMSNGGKAPTDLRLARHAEDIARRFKEIIEESHAGGRLNTNIDQDLRDKYGLKKKALRVLDPDRPSPTVTSMPDDLLHYSEPRTLTVRENARLQSIPDWFSFRGKYTSGGELRKQEVPRFTQVANAVPPLVARAMGEMLVDILAERESQDLPSTILKRLRTDGEMQVPERPA